jgi:hypothetical protein
MPDEPIEMTHQPERRTLVTEFTPPVDAEQRQTNHTGSAATVPGQHQTPWSRWQCLSLNRSVVISSAVVSFIFTAISTLLFSTLGIVPTWESKNIAKDSLEIDQWMARKEFLDQCQKQRVGV